MNIQLATHKIQMTTVSATDECRNITRSAPDSSHLGCARCMLSHRCRPHRGGVLSTSPSASVFSHIEVAGKKKNHHTQLQTITACSLLGDQHPDLTTNCKKHTPVHTRVTTFRIFVKKLRFDLVFHNVFEKFAASPCMCLCVTNTRGLKGEIPRPRPGDDRCLDLGLIHVVAWVIRFRTVHRVAWCALHTTATPTTPEPEV